MNDTQLTDVVKKEIKQREEEGCDVAGLREQLAPIEADGNGQRREALDGLLAELGTLAADPKYEEPSDLPGVRELRPDGPRLMQNLFSLPDLRNRTLGGWLGRCAGCTLGKPVEGWARERIRRAAEPDDNWPIRQYLGALTSSPSGKHRRVLSDSNRSLRGQISGMARDDDIDYTVTGLLVMERHGLDFSTADVGSFWLAELPYSKTYTAERIAYRNLVDGIPAEEAGAHLNPCREWIGAQIRADAFGYVCPGMPEAAAGLAYKDAFLSHRKNGIYGEMLVAAMIAAAFVEHDIHKIIEIGLSEIPHGSRLSEAVRGVVEVWDKTNAWEKVADHIDRHYGNLQGCHTITNAAIVILGLLAGEQDFTAGLAASIMPGYDTDCNGATVGSILGVRCGAEAIPAHWTEPLEDRLTTIIASVHQCKISDLAARTVRVAQKQLGAVVETDGAEPLTWGVA